MIVFKDTKGFQSRSDKPNENWTDEDVFVVEDGSKLENKIISNYPYYEFALDDNGDLIDITLMEKPIDLEAEKQKKINQLKEVCNRAIFEGFTSTNGYTYGFNELDQANFTQQSVLILNGSTGSIKWKTKDAGVVEHTVAGFQAVINDAAAHKLAQQEKYWALETQVLSATTLEEIEAVVW